MATKKTAQNHRNMMFGKNNTQPFKLQLPNGKEFLIPSQLHHHSIKIQDKQPYSGSAKGTYKLYAYHYFIYKHHLYIANNINDVMTRNLLNSQTIDDSITLKPFSSKPHTFT